MSYQKKVIDKYAVGQYCEAKFYDENGGYKNIRGWIVPNDYEMFRSMKEYKYAVLCAGGRLYAFNIKDLASIKLAYSNYELPRTLNHKEKEVEV